MVNGNRRCRDCGTPFVTHNHRVWFCGAECYTRHLQKKYPGYNRKYTATRKIAVKVYHYMEQHKPKMLEKIVAEVAQ